MTDNPSLQTFSNPHKDRNYLIEHHVHEFTSLCPITGQPDFASLIIWYVADKTCVELKSLKLYLQAFRSSSIFYEDATNVILNDLVAYSEPRWMLIETTWSVRGGIHTVIRAQHGERPSSVPDSHSSSLP